MPFLSTTPPVKKQCRSVRRRSGIALFKIFFPLMMRKANAERILNRYAARSLRERYFPHIVGVQSGFALLFKHGGDQLVQVL